RSRRSAGRGDPRHGRRSTAAPWRGNSTWRDSTRRLDDAGQPGKDRAVPRSKSGDLASLVVHFLMSRPAVWLVAGAVSFGSTVALAHLPTTVVAFVAAILIVVACIGIAWKDRTRVVG